MKPRNTLILFGVCCALLAYVWFIERHRNGTRDEREAAGRVAEVDRDKVNAVTIQNSNGTIELRKGSSKDWTIEKPVKDRADTMVVAQLFTSLENLRHDAKIDPENKDQLKDYGVADSNTKLKISSEGEKGLELLIGKDAAVEGKVYVRAEGSDTVYVIGNDLKNQLNKKADDFRDRKLADLTTQQINRLVVASKEGEIELEKKNNHWSITKPLKARADDQKVNDLIASTTTARIDQFLTDSSNLGNYGLTDPRGTISFFTEGAEKPVVLQIGSNGKEEKDKGKTYAKLSTRDSVVLVPKEIEKALDNRPNDLRDRKLVRVESDIVDRITIEVPNKPSVLLARKGESWVRKDGDKELKINATIPSQLLSNLQNTEVTNFVADTATELPKYGLDQPPVKVTLSSYASENTAETKAGDRPIVSVLFGKIEGDNGYAKVDDEPFIVAVPRMLIDSIPTDPIRLQDLTIYSYKPEEITAIELTKEGQPPVSLEKDNEGTWKLAKGDGTVNQTNVKTLATTIASLRAIRWAGATAPEHGFEKPSIVATFTATQGDKKVPGKLIIGSATPDEAYYSTAEGLAGTFVLNKPERDAFDAALLDRPAQQTTAPAAQQTTTQVAPAPQQDAAAPPAAPVSEAVPPPPQPPAAAEAPAPAPAAPSPEQQAPAVSTAPAPAEPSAALPSGEAAKPATQALETSAAPETTLAPSQAASETPTSAPSAQQ